MGKDSQVLVEVLANTIVKSQNTCLANAQNKVLIDIGRARNVNISKMSIVQLAAAEATCSQNIEVDIGALEFDLKQTLDQTVQSSEQDASDTFNLKNTISHTIKTGDVNSCLSSAVNEYKVHLGEVGGNVEIYDLHINQYASAKISKCLQEATFKVGDVPLTQYIDDTMNQIKSIRIIPPNSGGCEEANTLYYAMYGCVGAAMIIVGVVFVWYIIAYKKLYKKRN